jgi:uncharacterized protein with ParB-like and HNH nuclease domain
MQVKKLPIYEFLEGRSKTFVIPVYQRDYAWKIENCKKLWEDLVELNKTQKPTHFLGTIVNIYDKQEEWVIIDGQQRLATISLFLLALENYLKDKVEKTEEEKNLQEDILDYYLINKRSSNKDKRIRLKPNKRDRYYFEKLFENYKNIRAESNIILNYQFFYEKFSQEEFSTIQAFELFKKLEIVNIELEKNYDDPQLIFESLNSTGIDLSDGDLIRNYILMDLESNTQEKFYNQYWTKIENLTNDVAEFIRNFLMFRLQKNVTQTKRATYNEFKKYAEIKFDRNSEKMLQELLEYANIYSFFIQTKEHPNKEINQRLLRLYDLEFKVAQPFLFYVFHLLEQNNLNEKKVVNIIQLIESYAFRKIIVNNTTQGLNKFFLTLHKEIKKLSDDWKDQYCQIMTFIIKNKTGSQKFPFDEEFLDALMSKEVYKLRSKNRDFLLERLENYNSSYKVDISELTIEHIMPQTINNKWKESLGDDWEEIHKNYVHTLGNLTLTANNSKLSNKDFNSKKEIDLHTSKLKLSYELSNIHEWNKESITNRSKKLAKEAINIWQYPKTEFEKEHETEDVYILDENLDLRNTKPFSVLIDNKEYEILHWWEVKKLVCRKFYKESPTEFKEIMQKSEISRYFANSKDNKLLSVYEFMPNCFVDIHGSTFDVFIFTIKLCKLFEYDYSEISFKVKQ